MKKICVLLAILTSIVGVACNSSNKGQGNSAVSRKAGVSAADFTLSDISGKEHKLSSLRGHVVLLDFWATWCYPCRASIPGLVSVQEKFRDRGVIVLGVSMDEGSDLKERLSQFSKEMNISYPILISDKNVVRAYDVGNIPALFLIDKEGKIVDLFVGYADGFEEEISKQIGNLL